MEAFVGTFAVGDNVNTLRLSPTTDAGVPWGMGMGTGWTAELLVYRAGSSSVLTTLSGSWETADELACLFTIGTVTLLAPAAGMITQDYDAFLKLTKLTSTYVAGPAGDARTPYRFTVKDAEP